MKKYLVIYAHDSGIAQLDNVLVIEAESREEAMDKAAQECGMIPQAVRHMKAWPIDDLASGWRYFY